MSSHIRAKVQTCTCSIKNPLMHTFCWHEDAPFIWSHSPLPQPLYRRQNMLAYIHGGPTRPTIHPQACFGTEINSKHKCALVCLPNAVWRRSTVASTAGMRSCGQHPFVQTLQRPAFFYSVPIHFTSQSPKSSYVTLYRTFRLHHPCLHPSRELILN